MPIYIPIASLFINFIFVATMRITISLHFPNVLFFIFAIFINTLNFSGQYYNNILKTMQTKCGLPIFLEPRTTSNAGFTATKKPPRHYKLKRFSFLSCYFLFVNPFLHFSKPKIIISRYTTNENFSNLKFQYTPL